MLTKRQFVMGGMAGAATAGTPIGAARADTVSRDFNFVLYGDESEHLDAIARLRERGGADLVAGLIFALRFARFDDEPIVEALRQVTGDNTRSTWFDWMLWQEANPEVVPHESYINLKRELFFRIDQNFEVFLKPEYLRRDAMKIRYEEITWGGVRKDGIPSLDNPTMIPAAEADFMLGSDFVFGVEINGDIRAYPLRIMGWHEMFNDVIGGVPVALAYCTLCGSGILFETDVEGREDPFVFGSSGFLYRSNKLMFDRETHSLWNQFTGKPVVGPLVDSGIELRQRPVVTEPWIRWVARNPQTQVLSMDTGHIRNYGSGVVYDKYFRSPDLMFPALVDQTTLGQKDHVFGIRTTGGAKAWPTTAFEGGRVINDSVGLQNVVLIGDRLGRTVRAYDRGKRVFTAGDQPDVLRLDGAAWKITEAEIKGPAGQRLPRVAGHIAYWFAWDGYLGGQAEFFSE